MAAMSRISRMLTTVMQLRAMVLAAATPMLVLACVAPAFGQTPWWHVTSGVRPATLHAGVARDEVQEITAEEEEPGAGVLFALALGSKELGVFATEPLAKALGVPLASAANVQKALEEGYGAGNVTVTGGPLPATPLRVTSVGEYADRVLNGHKNSGPAETFTVEGEVGGAEGKVAVTGRPDGEVYVTVENLGDATASGGMIPIEISDQLPKGLRALAIAGSEPEKAEYTRRQPLPCSLASLTCTASSYLAPYSQYELRIPVLVEPGAKSGEANTASIAGGEGFVCHEVKAGSGAYSGAGCVNALVSHLNFERSPTGPIKPASVERPIVLGASPAFGAENYELSNEEGEGASATQAGAHPFQQTTTITFKQGEDIAPLEDGSGDKGDTPLAVLAKDIHFQWPPGLIGNPTPLAECSERLFYESIESGSFNACPPQSAVGIASLTVNEPASGGMKLITVPLFNLPPEVGEPARFGFAIPISEVYVTIDTSVRTGGDYGITVKVNNITQISSFLSSQVTVWGAPGDPRHNGERGWACLDETEGYEPQPVDDGGTGPCVPSEAHGEKTPPLLSLPTSCTGPLQSTVEGDSWAEPGPLSTLASTAMPALVGCNRLPFTPSIRVTPDGTAGSTPTGLNVDVHVPQEESLNPSGLAESDPRNIVVALPQGVAINPAAGDGLEACPEALAGFTGFQEFQAGSKTATFTERLPSPLEQSLNFCANASKIATVKIKTPILPNPVEGAVYLASQNQNPFGGLIAMYLIAEDPVSGVLIKLAGNVSLSESGQLTATFENSPQAPFEDAELHFFGGERAPLATPARCGAYTTTTSIAPWSGNAAATPSSTFEVTSGPHGAPCPGSSLPFSPSLTGGTTNVDAGAFSPFVMTFGREDGNQNLQSIQLHMPAGLEGLISTVKLCPEAQANGGTCGPESQIGETTVSAGVGGDPVSVTGGRVYITEGYEGAPYGLSIVNPVKAGPFDLEHDTSNPSYDSPCDCIVVRAKIDVNPQTAELTITTDPSGSHAIPHLIDGVPVEIKRVNVDIDRPNFTFNGTNCNPLAMTGSIGSDEGAISPLSVPFQVTNCALLKFSPKLSVTTGAHASKANGASLSFKISFPKGAQGTQSWFNEARFDIPKQLPARLSTLQQACLANTFETNRGACPKASVIGHAVVHTPVLPVPLEGPVYFVSYGGAKFPDAVLDLSGDNVHIELHGETFISNTGVTSATFRNTPDVPFESLEVNVPTGPYSEFGSNLPTKDRYDFCGQKLTMPTLLKAQNGLEINQNTPVTITGCPKPKKTKKTHKRHTKTASHKQGN
jgi:hypothetical protein